jgi:hypothetical protein
LLVIEFDEQRFYLRRVDRSLRGTLNLNHGGSSKTITPWRRYVIRTGNGSVRNCQVLQCAVRHGCGRNMPVRVESSTVGLAAI